MRQSVYDQSDESFVLVVLGWLVLLLMSERRAAKLRREDSSAIRKAIRLVEEFHLRERGATILLAATHPYTYGAMGISFRARRVIIHQVLRLAEMIQQHILVQLTELSPHTRHSMVPPEGRSLDVLCGLSAVNGSIHEKKRVLRIMLRSLLLFSLFCFVVALGCSKTITPGADVQNAADVNFAELKTLTSKSPFFWYVGSDEKHHYFRTDEGFYRLPIEFKMPHLQKTVDRKSPLGAFGSKVVVFNENIVFHTERMPTK